MIVYEIYVDVLLCTNIFISYFILLTIAKIFSIEFKRLRLLLSAFFGGICSLLIFLPEDFYFLGLITKLLIAVLVVLIAFRVHSFFNFFKMVASFYTVNFLFAGLIIFIWYFFDSNDIIVKNSTVYFNISPIFFIISTLISYIIIRVLEFFMGKRENENDFCKLQIVQNNKTFNLKAKVDTGHNLKDPFSNKSVVVVEYNFIKDIIPEKIKEYFFDFNTSKSCKLDHKITSLKFRAIPFNTVLGSGVMPAFKPEKIRIITDKNKVIEKDVFIAVCKGKLLGENYSALISPDVVG